MNNGYILVKDKDGKMKYFKDGKYFSVDEIHGALKLKNGAAKAEAQKKDLRPVYSFDAQKAAKEEAKIHIDLGKIKPPATRIDLGPIKPLAPAKMRIDLGPIKPTEPAKMRIDLGPIAAPIKKAAPAPLLRPKADMPKDEVDLEEIKPRPELNHQREGDQKLIEERVNYVVGRLKIKFSEPAIESRFRHILATYFRGVRTIKEVGYMFGLPKISGGLELPKDKIVLITAVLEQAGAEVHKARREVSTRPFGPEEMKKAEDVEHQITAPVPVKIAPSVAAPEKVLAPSVVKPAKMAQSVAVSREAHVERPRPNEAVKTARPVIRDVQIGRRLVGPIEELEAMNLENLRQLGRSAEEMSRQLKQKINYLAEQSLVKKVEGLGAWKKSPVFQLYIAMTMQGLKEKKAISDVIRARQIANVDCLTLSEYEMLGRLNGEIAL